MQFIGADGTSEAPLIRRTEKLTINLIQIMSLIRYQSPELSPFNRLATLRDEFDRLFDFSWPSRDTGLLGGWSPAIDVYDDKDNLVVTLEVPGMKKEDIEISLHDGMLTVSGERKDERERTEGQAFRSERYFGRFQRSLSLPTAVDANKVKANYKDGILTIHLPKSEEAKPKQINVSAS